MIDAAKLVELANTEPSPPEVFTRMALDGGMSFLQAPEVQDDAEYIEKALLTALQQLLLMPIAAANAAFTRPPDGAPWAQAHFMPEDAQVATLGIGGKDRHQGLLQVDVNLPPLAGTAEASTVVGDLRRAFSLGRVFTYGATSVRVTSFKGPRSREVDGYYRRSVTITWQAEISRPG
jgi:hypothetical protein